jgi:hypothetical protein
MTNATLLQTRVTPNDCEIQRGSGYPLRAPCPNSGPRRWQSRCLCLMHRGRWPDPLPSSCSLGWWRLCFTAGREESQSRAEQSADECSAPLPHPGGCHTPFREIGTKPPYVCPGCSNHTHGNNMINRCNVFNITSNSSYITTRGSEKDYINAAENN